MLGGLVVHRRQYPVAGAEEFALRLGGQQCHQRAVVAVAEVDGGSCFGQPALDAVLCAPGVEGGELGAGEGAFVFADHDRIDHGFWTRRLGHELGSLRSLSPWDSA
ncbi:hypothetical protein AB0F15_37210 [Amycolatopsis sp. NPDC026612]|uniref:hypothetical protein n=1 Tax=Amycolatopsis sp. NPDC026612 TaxID=3155466 RepID=UPI003410A4FC